MNRICIGTAQFGMDYGVANRLGKPNSDKVLKIIDTAWQNGISYFDTAASYGSSESVLGNIFCELGIQEGVKVITKLPTDFAYQGYPQLKQTVCERLNRLNIDQLYGLLFHRADQLTANQEISESLKRLKQEEMVLNVGVSVYEPEDAIYYSEHPDVDIIQVPFNVLDGRLLNNGFFSRAEENGKQVFIRSIYLQGLILMSEEQILESGMTWALEDLSVFYDFIHSRGCDVKSFAVSAVRNINPKAVMIMGVDSCDQLKQNMDVLSKSRNISKDLHELWWKKMPAVSNRLTNPSLW
jgi:aryl-alcohol dehydrogenase-like predicted oxidoreductase